MKAGPLVSRAFITSATFQALLLLSITRLSVDTPNPLTRSLLMFTGFSSFLSFILVVINGRRPQGLNESSFNMNNVTCVKCFISDLRYSHCLVCDTCFLERDHHCPWVGICISRNNHKHFIAYLMSTTCCLYAVAYRLCHQNPISTLLPLFIGLFFTSLTAYHCFLAAIGIRSIDFVKGLGLGVSIKNMIKGDYNNVYVPDI